MMRGEAQLRHVLRSPKVQLLGLGMGVWLIMLALGEVKAWVARLPVQTFQPAPGRATSAPVEATDWPLLRLEGGSGESQTVSSAGVAGDLDRAFTPPPAAAPKPRTISPVSTPVPNPAPEPADYAAEISARIAVQASSGRGAVINGRFVAWGDPLPVVVATPDRSGWERPRLVLRRGDHLQMSVSGITLSIPMTRSTR